MSGRRTLPELMAMSLVAAVCITLSAACFARYTSQARDNYAMDAGICAMQDIADLMAASKGDMAKAMAAFPGAEAAGAGMEAYFDPGFGPCERGGAAYTIRIGAPGRDGLLGTCRVTLSKADGTELSAITASWQEGREP